MSSVETAVHHIKVQRNADWQEELQIVLVDSTELQDIIEGQTATEQPVNLTGCTIISQVWNKGKTIKYADFSIEYTDRVNGIFKRSLSKVLTAGLPDEAVQDVLITNAAGLSYYYLEGMVYVSEGYSTATI
jgi:hypothetical protein